MTPTAVVAADRWYADPLLPLALVALGAVALVATGAGHPDVFALLAVVAAGLALSGST